METQIEQFKRALDRHSPKFGAVFSFEQTDRLAKYYELLLKWNPTLHLVAPCLPEEFAVRHVLESLMLLRRLPADVRVADVGTGAGLPLLPCLLIREDLRGLLIESSRRKAAFLKEVMRPIGAHDRIDLAVSRFEDLPSPDVGFVTCRALERFNELLPKLAKWTPPNALLMLFVGEALLEQIHHLLEVITIDQVPMSNKRFLVVASRRDSQDKG